ncbi:uncharacterized protein EV154DRAFT_526963 [Mucor mucedo]|uniref:uncharacterized protein n=1 Tax=Mucor mucedo TaxID=29922 RepID=UPI002220FB69|nr:uncharacterized protein EV154DRAFT_526963 [Mucor mucedo]KAI7874789.1 hypothetical protein EV154DRAFT_526963 [Mucor mucedo]
MKETINLVGDIGKVLYDAGIDFYNKKNYAPALSYFVHAAQLFNQPDAQYNVGHMCKEGYGTEKDYSEALYWLTKASENGRTEAMFEIGQLYLDENKRRSQGSETLLDPWPTKSVEQGYLAANLDLFVLYQDNPALPRHEYTMRWLRDTPVASSSSCPTYGLCKVITKYLKAHRYEGATKYSNDPIYELALRWLVKAAENGVVAAMHQIGMLYLCGTGVKKQEETACQWLTRSAERNDLSSQLELGIFYQKSIASQRDYEKSMHWFEKAADTTITTTTIATGNNEQGKNIEKMAVAQYYIGMFYKYGLKVSVNYKLAWQWFGKSADNGCLLGKMEIGLMYYQGMYVPKDEERGMRLLKFLVSDGHVYSQVELCCIYSKGNPGVYDYTPSMQWFLDELDDATSQSWIGVMYLRGWGVEKNELIALQWFRKALDRAPTSKIGNQDTHLVPLNWNEAVLWYKSTVAKNGNHLSPYGPAQCYLEDQGSVHETFANLDLLQSLAAQGNSQAQNSLGLKYIEGELIEQNYGTAMMWFEKAISNEENVDALRNIIDMHQHGWVAEKNPVLVLHYLLRLARAEAVIRNKKNIQTSTSNDASTSTAINETKHINSVITSLKMTLHEDSVPQKEIKEEKENNVKETYTEEDPVKFFHVEDTSKFLHVENTSQFFYVEDTQKVSHAEESCSTQEEKSGMTLRVEDRSVTTELSPPPTFTYDNIVSCVTQLFF